MIHIYKCTNCEANIEVDVRFGDDPPTSAPCKVCGGDGNKVFQPVGVIFHGWGWATTDGRKKRSDEIRDSGK